MVHIIIAVVITAVVAILLTYLASNAHFKKSLMRKSEVQKIVREQSSMKL